MKADLLELHPSAVNWRHVTSLKGATSVLAYLVDAEVLDLSLVTNRFYLGVAFLGIAGLVFVSLVALDKMISG